MSGLAGWFDVKPVRRKCRLRRLPGDLLVGQLLHVS
jgi:hypothetical protein